MFVLLDGGMGRELQRIGAPFSQPLWSAQALIEAPDAVYQAHQNFIDAGCDVITVNSYACVPFHLGDTRYQEQGFELAELAAQIAQRAAEDSERDVHVAGCIPPVLGSYRPDLFNTETATPIIQTLIEAQGSYVDFWLAETIGSIEEFHTICDALTAATSNKPAYFAFSLMDSVMDQPRLRSGEAVVDAVKAACERDVNGILFNCSQPEVMLDAIAVARVIIDTHSNTISLGAYANGFSVIQQEHQANDALTTVRELSADQYAAYVKAWLDAGSNMVGGCCAIFPEHIAYLDSLRKK
ncbi:homocysteine S-methyltransferase family protein [Enterovibrio sp. ZSDZ42]|uniref:Homocysteine S-methyltransferase family protein n=1 Tax=Enterovibrio gelatinilyticus TaxID=2899819 RepID=A0ABT5QZC6_9GAMM|nr:homocysteine S-methyltransferase family protein [Enterovibrio sp. ZSDZ42]MDD1793354.1 homocysteine S-methyltransferase family protein [Enterovibrio sp. ZSDZ42]